MSEANRSVCQRPGCGGPESGVCIENFGFDECPHLIPMTDDVLGESHAVPEVEIESTTGDYVTTSPGATLDSAGCDAFLRRRSALVVAIMAGPEAGKTTLLSTIYELARRGKIERVEFAGSETILGFEQRCFLARASSQLERPDTPRTRVVGPRFLHLHLMIEGDYVHLLIADRPGENYTRAIDRPAVLSDYEEVARANHLLLVVDGKEFADNPHGAVATARRLFRGTLENGLREDQQVHLVVTKIDLFAGEKLAELRARADDLWKELKKRAPHHVVQLHMTGARARAGEGIFGEGVDSLVRGLVDKKVKREFKGLVPTGTVEGTSMLDQLMRQLAAR